MLCHMMMTMTTNESPPSNNPECYAFSMYKRITEKVLALFAYQKLWGIWTKAPGKHVTQEKTCKL